MCILPIKNTYAESTNEYEYNSNEGSHKRYGYLEGDTKDNIEKNNETFETTKADTPLADKKAYALYYEQLHTNIFIGYTPTIFLRIHDDSDSWGYLLADFRLGYIEADSPQEANAMLGTLNFGIGATYGFKHDNPFNLYTEVGFDFLEFIANEILQPSHDDSDETAHEDTSKSIVSIDTFFTLGLSYRINKTITVSTYAKINSVSGYLIRDHSRIYYGGKITKFY